MRKGLVVCILYFFVLSCTGVKDTENKPIITVSIEPFKYFVDAIVADNYSINVIVPPGSSPATFEPPPSVIRNLSNSDALIVDGFLGYELAWKGRLLEVNPDIDLIDLSENQELIAAEIHRHEDNEHYTGVDPHFWVSPKSALKMAEMLKDYFIESDPDNKTVYWENYILLSGRINSIDKYIESLLHSDSGKAFMIFHPALSYLARDYNLEQISVETDGKEPSLSSLKSFIDRGRNEGIKTIFVQREFDIKNAETIASEIGADVYVIDPLAADWESNIRKMAEALAKGFNTN